jgi:inner membrane protein
MDPVTHGLAGALIAEAGFAQKLGGRSRLILAGTAMFPDLDIVYRFDSLPTYIANHRALTHSFVGLLASGLLIGGIMGRLDEERRYISWIAACCVALFSHQILDLITSYGTVVLYPFSHARFYFDWVFIIDFFLTGLLLVSLIAARLSPSGSIKRAGIGIAIVSCYIAFCGLNHSIALHHLKIAAERQGISYESAAAIPQPTSPLRWSGILNSRLHSFQVTFYSFQTPSPPFQVFTRTTDSFYEQIARESELGSLYLWFARYPVVSESIQNNIHIIEFSDLRFYIKLHRFPLRKPFMLYFRIDQSGKILESRFTRM